MAGDWLLVLLVQWNACKTAHAACNAKSTQDYGEN